MKKKIHKLDFKLDFDYDVIAISSHENDYRLCWAINQNMKLDLSKDEDLHINIKNKELVQNFSVYSSNDEENEIKYELIACTSENGFLFNKFKNIDYILKVSGETDADLLKQLNVKLNKIDIIIASYIVDNLTKTEMKKLMF